MLTRILPLAALLFLALSGMGCEVEGGSAAFVWAGVHPWMFFTLCIAGIAAGCGCVLAFLVTADNSITNYLNTRTRK